MSAIVWWAITGVAFWHAPGSETECRISRVLEVGFVIAGRTAAGFAVHARRALARRSGVRSLLGRSGAMEDRRRRRCGCGNSSTRSETRRCVNRAR